MGAVFLGHDKQAAGHAIQSMHNTGSHQPRDANLFVEIRLEGIGQCAFAEVSHGVRDQAGRLIDDQYPRVFVNDIQWDAIRRQQLVGRFQQSHGHSLPSEYAILLARGNIIDRDTTRHNKSVESPRGVISEMAGKKRVDSNSG